MLEIKDMSVGYGIANPTVLKNINLTVEEQEVVTIIGLNGAGKTTLLRTISGYLRPTKGTITLNCEDITCEHPIGIVKKGISQVLEGRHIFPSLSVKDNLALGSYLRVKAKESKAKIAETMEFVYTILPRLKERETQLAATLSGGEQQMLAIGRALMGDPKVLLLDEPSMGLAPNIVERIYDVLFELNQTYDMTILLVEQNAEAALSIAERAYILQVGEVVLSGECEDIIESDVVRELYFGEELKV